MFWKTLFYFWFAEMHEAIFCICCLPRKHSTNLVNDCSLYLLLRMLTLDSDNSGLISAYPQPWWVNFSTYQRNLVKKNFNWSQDCIENVLLVFDNVVLNTSHQVQHETVLIQYGLGKLANIMYSSGIIWWYMNESMTAWKFCTINCCHHWFGIS